MSHRITAMLELYGGRVIGQLNLFHDKEGKSPEAGTGTMVRSYWSIVFFNQKKTEFSILFVCFVLQFNRVGTLLMVDYSFSHTSIISFSRLLSYAPGHWINRPCLKPPHCVSHCVLLFPTVHVRTGAIRCDLMHRDRLGPLRHRCGGWLWLLLTIIYGPSWLKAGELETESWARS